MIDVQVQTACKHEWNGTNTNLDLILAVLVLR